MLWEITHALNHSFQADLIYFDQDVIDWKGRRSNPWFKPEWSPELFLAVNYIKPSILRREKLDLMLIGSKENYPRGFLTLALELTKNSQMRIMHIPKILYHQFSDSGQPNNASAVGAELRQWHRIWSRSKLEEKLDRPVAALDHGNGIVQYTWQSFTPRVSIVIASKEKEALLRRCLQSILTQTKYPDYEVIVVDSTTRNDDDRGYDIGVFSDERFRIVRFDESFNYASANNLGARHASGEILLFLNNDIEIIDESWLEELVRWLEFEEIGVVGGKLLFPSGRIQHAGIILGLGGHAGHVYFGMKEGDRGPFGTAEWYRDYYAVTGACLMLRKNIFNEVNGFNEEFELAFGDVELCLKVISRGYRVMYTPFARLHHDAGSTRGRYTPKADMQKAFQILEPYLERGDLFFNPNLSYAHPYPGLAGENDIDLVERVKRMLS
jgi:GT2 family glycosyltransferase